MLFTGMGVHVHVVVSCNQGLHLSLRWLTTVLEEKDNLFKTLIKSQQEFSFWSIVTITVKIHDITPHNYILEKK